MAIDGITSTPFSSKTMLTDYSKTGNIDKVIEASRAKYSKPVAEVEEFIASKLVMSSPQISELPSPSETRETKSESKKETIGGEDIANTEVGNEDELISRQSDLPEELSNVKMSEDYETEKWYFLNRTNFKKATGKKVAGEDDTPQAPKE